jgi:hypothetical protein
MLLLVNTSIFITCEIAAFFLHESSSGGALMNRQFLGVTPRSKDLWLLLQNSMHGLMATSFHWILVQEAHRKMNM